MQWVRTLAEWPGEDRRSHARATMHEIATNWMHATHPCLSCHQMTVTPQWRKNYHSVFRDAIAQHYHGQQQQCQWRRLRWQ